MHFYLLSNNSPWVIDKNHRNLIDTCIYEILIPVNLGNVFQFRYVNLFSQFGHLRSLSVIQIGTVLMKLILTLVSNVFPEQYKLYYLMLYEDLNFLMSPAFKTKQSVIDLENRILELTIIGHGLFPPSEFRLIHHQLYCISKYIRQGGTIKNFWGISGERIMGIIKKSVPEGGPAYDYSAITKYSKSENSITKDFYSKDIISGIKYLKLDLIDSSELFSYNKYTKRLLVKMFDYKLHNQRDGHVIFVNELMDSFLFSLVSYIKTKFKCKEDAILNSQYYSLFMNFKTYNKLQKNTNITFYDYIVIIAEVKITTDPNMSNFCKKLMEYLNNTVIRSYKNVRIMGTYFCSISKKNNEIKKEIKICSRMDSLIISLQLKIFLMSILIMFSSLALIQDIFFIQTTKTTI
jgi:hypothetical protein